MLVKILERNARISGLNNLWANVEVRGSRSEAQGTTSAACGCPARLQGYASLFGLHHERSHFFCMSEYFPDIHRNEASEMGVQFID